MPLAPPSIGRCSRLRTPGWCLALLALSVLPLARAQKGSRPPPDYLQLSPPDQAKGREVVESFRQQVGIAGEFYLEFELRVLPRHGSERVLLGRLWGSRNAAGPIWRVCVRPLPSDDGSGEVRLLIQSGSQPALWRWTGGSAATAPLAAEALFEPVAGTDLTPFDLQMPFLYWPDFIYEGLARIHGRPAHQFLFYPPADVAQRTPALRGIRAYLDTQYTALVQVESIGENDKPLKSVSVLDLKKIGEQWIVKEIDLRDEATRNKTRFAVTAAALNQVFPAAVLDPAHLAEAVAPPRELVTLKSP